MTSDSPAKSSALHKVVTILMWSGFLVAVLAFPLAFALDKTAGRDVILLSQAADGATVEAQRDQFDDTITDPVERRTAIVEIYGSSPAPTVERVLFIDEKDLIVPKEDASIALLRPTASHPVQVKSAYFTARFAALGGAAAFVVLLIVRRFLR